MPPTAQVVIGTAAAGVQAYQSTRSAYEALLGFAPYAKKVKLMLGDIGPNEMPHAVAASSSSIRVPRSRLPRPLKREVEKCCTALFEEKYLPSVVSHTVGTAATGGAVTSLNDFSQGTGVSARVGSSIKMHWLILKGFISLQNTSATDVYRMVLVVDHEAFGSAPTYAQVFESTTIVSPPNFQARPRFRILADESVALVNPTAPGASASIDTKCIEMRIPLGMHAYYNGNAGTVGDLVKNSLTIIEATQAGVVTSNWQAHLIYTDA